MSGTPGGNKLRHLRERSGKTQLAVELDAELGSGYLQRVEAGKVANPERKTLERILSALQAGYSERREILELFGYTVDNPLPGEAEISWALSVCRAELSSAPFPAYLLDCGHRLLAYNRYYPYLFGFQGDNPAIAALLRRSMLEIIYDEASPFYRLLQDPGSFLLAGIHALKYEMSAYSGEKWYQEMLAGLQANYPLFRHYWEQATRQPDYAVAARLLTLIGLNAPGSGLLNFRLSAEPFIRDRRFRIIYYLPGDPKTIGQCAEWARQGN